MNHTMMYRTLHHFIRFIRVCRSIPARLRTLLSLTVTLATVAATLGPAQLHAQADNFLNDARYRVGTYIGGPTRITGAPSAWTARSTYLGGTHDEQPESLALGTDGSLVAVGELVFLPVFTNEFVSRQ